MQVRTLITHSARLVIFGHMINAALAFWPQETWVTKWMQKVLAIVLKIKMNLTPFSHISHLDNFQTWSLTNHPLWDVTNSLRLIDAFWIQIWMWYICILYARTVGNEVLVLHSLLSIVIHSLVTLKPIMKLVDLDSNIASNYDKPFHVNDNLDYRLVGFIRVLYFKF